MNKYFVWLVMVVWEYGSMGVHRHSICMINFRCVPPYHSGQIVVVYTTKCYRKFQMANSQVYKHIFVSKQKFAL